MRRLIRWYAYPLIFGGVAVFQMALLMRGLPYWPWVPLASVIGVGIVPLLERLQPYEIVWNIPHDDVLADALHALFNLTLIFISLEIANVLRELVPVQTLWPVAWPLWISVLVAGVILDFGMWLMHWLSHRKGWLWRLHAVHHSARRLYWLNGERRHPFSALVLAAPGLIVTVILGAPTEALGCWFVMMAVHLAFQHANLDYSVGCFRYVLGVAEIHRWHHKREYEDAQVNFGEFWMVWDHVFGTFKHQVNGVKAGDVGMRENMPQDYVGQLVWPFKP